MNKCYLHILCLIIAFVMALGLTACQSTNKNISADMASYNISLYLKDYTPKFSGIQPAFRGKKLCLSNIRNEAGNTTNFSYYNKDNRVKYVLSNKANTPLQLIPSFFWYAYQKAFEHAGLTILDRCPGNIPELWIIFESLNDEELKLTMTLLENRETIFRKNLTITLPPAAEHMPEILQARAYEMIDVTIKAILNDSEFQAGFL